MKQRSGARMACTLRGVALTIVTVVGGTVSTSAEGLPGEYLINSRWRAMHAERSALSNPANLAYEDYLSLRVAAAKPLTEFNLVESNLAWPFGLHQTVGLTWSGLFTTTYAQTGLRLPDGTVSDPFAETDSEVSEAQNAFTLTYAAGVWRRLALGLNVNVAQQSLFSQDSRAGVGLDIGLRWRLIRHPVLGEHAVGVGVQNLLAPRMSDEEHFARNLAVQWSGVCLEGRLGALVEFNLRDFFAAEDLFRDGRTLERSALMRLDAWLLRVLKVYGLACVANGRFDAGGFGAGINVPSVNAGRDLEFLYQFLAVNEGLAITHSTSLRIEMGRHREEQFARRMAARLNIAPNDLYTRALALYAQRKYWDAMLLFSELLRTYPDFFKNDWVSYFRASCMEELGFDAAADTLYRRGRRAYGRTLAGPYMDLGVMRLAYRRNDQRTLDQQLRELNKPTVPDSLKFHAYYLTAQMHMREGRYRTARALLEVIPPNHPEYPFARHSLGIAAIAEGNLDAAVDNLQMVVQTRPVTPAQVEIVNRSYVFLGYLFYERAGEIESGLAKAVSALRLVAATSMYREDALLGLGWCALKARQWADCLEAGRSLERESPRMVNRCEGQLLQAYAHIMQEEYPAALSVLSQAAAVLDTLRAVPPDGGAGAAMELRNVRSEYETLGGVVVEITDGGGGMQDGGKTEAERARQEALLARIKTLRAVCDNAARTAFFSRMLETLREDVGYALARVKHVMAGRGVLKAQEQLKGRTQSIDAEIERLQQQLKQIGP